MKVRLHSFKDLTFSDVSKLNEEVFPTIRTREKYPYSEFFWSAFSRQCGKISVRMQKNTDQENSENGHFSRSVKFHEIAQ